MGRGRSPAARAAGGRPGDDGPPRRPREPGEARRAPGPLRAAGLEACSGSSTSVGRGRRVGRLLGARVARRGGLRDRLVGAPGVPGPRHRGARRPPRRSRGARARATHRFLHAFPSVDNAPSNAICRKLGFTLLGECDFEYPPGNRMRCNDWRLDLRAAPLTPERRRRDGPRVGRLLERVVERRELVERRARSRSASRRTRRSSAAAARAGRCRSRCRGARPRTRARRCCRGPRSTRPSGCSPAPRYVRPPWFSKPASTAGPSPELDLDRDVADQPRAVLAHGAQVDQPDAGQLLVAELVGVAEQLVAAAHAEHDRAARRRPRAARRAWSSTRSSAHSAWSRSWPPPR